MRLTFKDVTDIVYLYIKQKRPVRWLMVTGRKCMIFV